MREGWKDLYMRGRVMADAIKEAVKDIKFYLDRIEHLQRELAEERRSREEAQAFAWKFSDALRKIEAKHWYPTTAEIAREALGEKKDGEAI
jgi:hypothetical protein